MITTKAGVAITLLVLFLGGLLFSLWSGLTFYAIMHEEPRIARGQEPLKKGDIVSPLEGLDFEQGEWTAYLAISPVDFPELKGRFSRNCLKLTDRETMKRMRDEWKMVYTGADAATVESVIVFFKDDEVVFSSNIVLTEGRLEGLQNRSLGFTEPLNKGILLEYCSKFQPVYWPVIFL